MSFKPRWLWHELTVAHCFASSKIPLLRQSSIAGNHFDFPVSGELSRTSLAVASAPSSSKRK